jgi:hypothetical protein
MHDDIDASAFHDAHHSDPPEAVGEHMKIYSFCHVLPLFAFTFDKNTSLPSILTSLYLAALPSSRP